MPYLKKLAVTLFKLIQLTPKRTRPTREIDKGEGHVRWEPDPDEAPVVRGMYRILPAILSEGEWEELQQRLRIRRETPEVGRNQVLLSGIVRCGHCRGPMVGEKGLLRVLELAD